MSEKRVVILEVPGDCRNLRVTDEGTYCAAYIHGGWERIEPKACLVCKREKYLSGRSKNNVISQMAFAIAKKKYGEGKAAALQFLGDDSYKECIDLAQYILDDLLERDKP